MSQSALFAAEPRILVEDDEDGIRYLPGVVDPAVATRWFGELRDCVRWHAQRRPMYDRVVDVPRLTGGFALADPSLPAALREAAQAVREAAGSDFNHVGLNYYRDGHDSVAPHNDKLHSIVAGHPIVLLSLGATRRMDIREKAAAAHGGKRRAWRLDLEAGSLLVMSHASQRRYDHGVPKVAHSVGPRISCAFRVRPDPARG